jgi:predicted PurR-regulated permease PerM
VSEPIPARTRSDQERIRTAVEIAIRLSVLAGLAAWCFQIIWPFIGIVVWGLVISVAATDPYERVVEWLGGRRTLATTLFIVLGLLLVMVPAALLTGTLVEGAQHLANAVRSEQIHVPPPIEGVARIPIVGPRIDAFWRLASNNLQAAAEQLRPQLEAASLWLLSAARSAGVGLVQIIASLIVSGLLLQRRAQRRAAIRRVAVRLAGAQGEALMNLASATVRSVVVGILGVAFIQAVLAGVGLTVAGSPWAGLWALLVLVAAIVQLPVFLVLLVPIGLAFSNQSTPVAIAVTIWCVFVSLIDNVLKPLLFARGVRAPLLVIFLGAIGGMLSMGILGLFVGAVVLVLAFELLRAWLGFHALGAASDGEPRELTD